MTGRFEKRFEVRVEGEMGKARYGTYDKD